MGFRRVTRQRRLSLSAGFPRDEEGLCEWRFQLRCYGLSEVKGVVMLNIHVASRQQGRPAAGRDIMVCFDEESQSGREIEMYLLGELRWIGS